MCDVEVRQIFNLRTPENGNNEIGMHAMHFDFVISFYKLLIKQDSSITKAFRFDYGTFISFANFQKLQSLTLRRNDLF